MSKEVRSKLLIIGSGAAGYTAAIYAARASLEPVLLQGSQPGGQLTITTDVENFPGFAESIEGPWLMEQMQKQAENVGTKVILDNAVSVDFDSRPFKIQGDNAVYIADSLVIATGASARWLGMESEKKFQGYGVSACATCDGFFFRDQEVIVIGGGNSAVEEALFMTNHASKVTLIHRRDELRAEKILQERLLKNPKVDVKWDSVVDEFYGEEKPVIKLTGVKIRNVKTDKIEDFKTDGAFVAIGHDPNTELFKGKLDMDKENYLISKSDSTETNIAGVFAAGDVKDKIYRQAITAAGMGCMAALQAEKFLAEQE